MLTVSQGTVRYLQLFYYETIPMPLPLYIRTENEEKNLTVNADGCVDSLSIFFFERATDETIDFDSRRSPTVDGVLFGRHRQLSCDIPKLARRNVITVHLCALPTLRQNLAVMQTGSQQIQLVKWHGQRTHSRPLYFQIIKIKMICFIPPLPLYDDP